MRIAILSISAILLLSTSCGPSGRDSTLERFQRVNDSLSVSLSQADHARSQLPPIPFMDMGCPEFQERSDHLHSALERVELALAPIFSDLSGVPQDDREAGLESFDRNDQGLLLFQAVTAAFDDARLAAPSDSLRSVIDAHVERTFPHGDAAAWRANAFAGADRATVVTALARLNDQCRVLNGICDQSLLKACIEQGR